MNVHSTDNISPYIDEALCLVLMWRMGKNTGSKCIRSDSVASQGGHLCSKNAQHLAEETLDKAVQATSLPQTAGLTNVEEIQVAEMVFNSRARQVRCWGQVDSDVWQGCRGSKEVWGVPAKLQLCT